MPFLGGESVRTLLGARWSETNKSVAERDETSTTETRKAMSHFQRESYVAIFTRLEISECFFSTLGEKAGGHPCRFSVWPAQAAETSWSQKLSWGDKVWLIGRCVCMNDAKLSKSPSSGYVGVTAATVPHATPSTRRTFGGR